MDRDLILFALDATRPFGENVAFGLGRPLSSHEERDFEGGEHKVRPLEEVGGRDVYVIQSLHGETGISANDKLVRMLFFIGALKDAGAASVSAIAPYLAYSRKDRRTKPRDPVNSRYTAALFEAMGTDRFITVDVHNISAFENAFRSCKAENLAIAGLMARYLAPSLGDGPIAVVSPDAGGNKRAELFRSELETQLGRSVGKAIMDKHRSSGKVSGHVFAGDVSGCTAIIIDDLISSGTTILRSAEACRTGGARQVIAAAAHAMCDASSPLFGTGAPDRIVVTDTIPLAPALPATALDRIEIVETAPFVADVIGRMHSGEPVSELLPYD